MSTIDESSWIAGNRAAWRRLLGTAISELVGEKSSEPLLIAGRAVSILEDTKVELRALFDELGIDWPEDLHIADVVSKHLAPHIRKIAAED